jgi:hypothetical protein
MRKFCIVSFLFLIFAGVARPQIPLVNSCPAEAPITIQVGDIKADTDLVNVVITNKGPKSISAVILHWKFAGSKGTVPGSSFVDMAVAGQLLLAGQNVTTQANVSAGQDSVLESVEVDCSTVLFSGKDAWGDRKSSDVIRLLGIRTGIRTERNRLMSIYQAQGSDKLIAELKRPVAK